ncbi:MAG: mannose-6-phosphate isomerase, partial [Clostridia bacterium]|nr:mannose-6-phosphate isomerase [Clostridia bacterium]
MYPIKLNPIFKEIVWGGERLKSDYGYESDLNNIAEAWVLTARNDGDNTVKNGEFSGESFTELIKKHPEFLGEKGAKYNEFPLLIKFIDAKSDLSIQVHPDDDYARVHENSLGKTEAWYVVDCADEEELIYGFNKEITKE